MIKSKTTLIIGIFLGVLFLVVGVAGLVLPIIPGIIFIILGLGFIGYPISLKWFERFKIKKRKSSH